MHVQEVPGTDLRAVRRLVAVAEAVRRADAPWDRAVTERGKAGELRHGWDGEPPIGLLATVGGADVAVGEYQVTHRDNRHLAWLGVDVHPAHRRRGHGTALLSHLLDRARADGRTCAGISSWDASAPRAFAARHGFEPGSVEVNRRQHVRALDRGELDRLYAEAARHASAYELIARVGATPPEELAALAELARAINDAPTDELDLEPQVLTPDRIAAYERAQEARGQVVYRVVARHRASGELAGHTVVVVDTERPHLGEQHETAVVRSHRGHRLGVLLKVVMLRLLAEAQPQLEIIDTWNAESNGPMVAVNETLGYRVVGRALAYQRPL